MRSNIKKTVLAGLRYSNHGCFAFCLWLALTSLNSINAQTTFTWGSNSATDWSLGSNWLGGIAPGSAADPDNNDIAQWNSSSTGSTIQLNFGTLGSEYHLGTLQTVGGAVAKTLGSNSNTPGILQLNGTGVNNLIIDHQGSSGFTIAPQAGGGTGPLSLRLNAGNSTINNVGALTLSANISGTGSNGITKTGSGALTLSGNNTFTGGVTINGGGVNFIGNSAFGTGTITVGPGAAAAAGFAGSPGTPFLNNTNSANTTLSNNIVLASPLSATTYTLQKTASGGQLNLTGDISGGNANTKLFFQTSTGGDNTTTFRLAGNNTFEAQMELWRGGLVVGNVNGLGAATNLLRLNPNNNTTLGDLRFEVGGTFANPIQFLSATAINPNAHAVVLSGNLSGTTAWQVIGATGGGTGSLTLTGANNTNSGQITVQTGGTLQVGNGGGTGTLGTGNVVNNGTLNFNRSDTQLLVNNNISGIGAVQQTGTGTTTLAGANTFSGPLNINSGTLALGMTGSVATSNIHVNAGARFDVSSAFGYTLGTSQTLTLGRTTAPGIDAVGDFSIAGTVNVAGSGTMGTATFANNLSLVSGTVAFDLANVTDVGGGVNDLVSVAGDLSLFGVNNIAVTAANGLTNGSYTLFNYGTLTGNSSNLSLLGVGAGTTRQTFAFDVGTGFNSSVKLDVAGDAADLVWTGNNGATWDLVNTSDNFSGDADNRFYNFDNVLFNGGASNVNLVGNLAPGSVTVDSANDFTFTGSGSIVGTTSLVKSGTGNLTLLTNNTYTGNTLINEGSLTLGNGGTSGSIAGNVINNGTLTINRSDAFNFSNLISGSGNLVLQGGGSYTLSNANSHSGSTTVANSTLNLTSDSVLGAAPASPTAGHLVLDNATVNNTSVINLNSNRGMTLNGQATFNTGAALTYNGGIDGTGGIVKAGTSVLTLGGANTFSGGFTHNGGTVTVTHPTGLGTGTFTWNAYSRLNMAVADGDSWTVGNNFVLPSVGGSSTLMRIGDGSPTANTTLRLTGVLSGGSAGQNYRLVDSDQGGNHNHVLILDNPNNTMSGTLEMWRGTLAITSDGALGNIGRIRHYTENLGGSFRFDADQITVGASREFQLVSGPNPFNTQNYNATIASNIFGPGLMVKQGTGTLTLTGGNTNTGGVNVAEGTLLVNNLIGSGTGTGTVTVGVDAILGGTGSIGGPVIVNGTLAPGAAGVGSLQTAALTLNGTFAVEADSSATELVDFLQVNGALTLNEATLIANGLDSVWSSGAKFTLISYIDGGSGIESGFAGLENLMNYTFGGSRLWTLNYNDSTPGSNFLAQASGGGGTHFVTITAVPEPSALLILLGLSGGMALVRRRQV